MSPRSGKTIAVALLLGAFSAVQVSVRADGSNSTSHYGGGAQLFHADPLCPLKDFPDLESLVPVPTLIDPIEDDLVGFSCYFAVTKDENPVKKATGKFTSKLVVLDNTTGTFETFDIATSKLKTDEFGLGEYNFEIPTALFAVGFKSGDTSAWAHTRLDLKTKKMADTALVGCLVEVMK